MKIVTDKDIPFIKGILEPYAEVEYLSGSKITRGDLLDADALIVRTRTRCDASLLSGTKVKFIASATIGYDHIGTEFCESNGIFWTSAPGCNSSSVKQYIASALMTLAELMNFTLSGKVIGVVGVGNVGSKVASFSNAIGMKVLMNDPPRERVEGKMNFISLKQLVDEADIISLHVPLNMEGTDKTYHLFDQDILMSLRPHQILINSSRGEVVDTSSLGKSIKDKRLSACVLDVWENEPKIDTKLLSLVSIGTPHIAGYSADGKANGTAMSVQALSRYFGLDLNEWYPKDIPIPKNTVIEYDCANKRSQSIIRDLIISTYNILIDDQRLRNSCDQFEKLRSAYPLRREFPIFTAKLKNADPALISIIQDIGFKTIIS